MNPSPTNRQTAYEFERQDTASSFRFDPLPPRGSAASVPKPPSSSRGSGGAGGRQITRNRASYSCHTCRRRKVKCDKVHPVCGNCLKNGHECVYDAVPKKDVTGRAQGGDAGSGHGVKRRRETSRQPEGDINGARSGYNGLRDGAASQEQRTGSQAIEARLDKLTSMIERLSRTNGPLSQEDVDRQNWAQNPDLDRVARDRRQSAPRPNTALGNGNGWRSSPHSRQPSPRRNGDCSGDEFPVPSGHATDLVDPVGSLNLGHLSLEDGGKSRYVGTTYWAYISDEINELNQLLRDQYRSHDTSNDVSSEGTAAEPGTRTPVRNWKFSSRSGTARGRRRSYTRSDDFPRSVLFPSGDSPSVNDKAIEPEMLEHVPTKRQSHILYKGFMSGVHAISPVLHPPTVLKMYNAFWDWYDYSSYSGEPCPDPSFIPLLYAIWYGGSVTISIRTIKAEFNVSSRSELSTMYNDEVTRWLTKISFPRSPSLPGLAAFLIVQTILSKEEEPLTSSLFVSLALRVAQTMGLHRDPAQFGIEPCEAESRRRVWWHIVHMDGVVAMSSGLPPLVSDENYWDVRMTSEVKDTLLGTPEAEHYERLVESGLRPPDNPDDPTLCGGPSMVNVYYLSAKGKYTMARAIRKILKIQLGTKPVTRKDMEDLRSILLDLRFKLNSLISRIPEAKSSTYSREGSVGYSGSSDRSRSFSSRSPVEMRTSNTELPGDGSSGCPEQYHTPVLVAFHKWARILLSLFIDKAYCVAYQPFLKNAKSRIWPAARQGALRHCHGFMEKFIALATDPDFQPFQWSWPGNHQPMHATMIMLIDLYERPNSPEASKSRAFVDKIFSLSGPDGGVVGGEDGITTSRPLRDGGREAWDMMRRLREKAWQKAGLDPHQLWTEQAQIQAGVAPAPEESHEAPWASFADRYYSLIKDNNTPASSRPPSSEPPRRPAVVDRQLADFSKTFYNMTRAHMLQNPVPSRSSPLRYSYQLPPLQEAVPTSAPRTPPQLPPPPTPPQFSIPHAAVNSRLESTFGSSPAVPSPADSSMVDHANSSSNNNSNSSNNPLAHILSTPSSSTATSFLDPLPAPVPANANAHANGHTMATTAAAASTPPSMVDPNLTFDWDQWDAVFGQHLPVADEFMELDPVAGGFGFGDFGGTDGTTGMGMGMGMGHGHQGGHGGVGMGMGMGMGIGMGGNNWADFG